MIGNVSVVFGLSKAHENRSPYFALKCIIQQKMYFLPDNNFKNLILKIKENACGNKIISIGVFFYIIVIEKINKC